MIGILTQRINPNKAFKTLSANKGPSSTSEVDEKAMDLKDKLAKLLVVCKEELKITPMVK